MNVLNKRIFDTDNALKGAFNGNFGKWQTLSYALLTLGFAIVSGWLNKFTNYTLLSPNVSCIDFEKKYGGVNSTNRSVIQRLTGRDKYEIIENNKTIKLDYNYSNNHIETVVTDYNLFCDLEKYANLPAYAHVIGFITGAVLLGILADKGGRKIIVLACIWATGVMSVFQVVGHDFISYVFFQLFLAIFSGGVHVVFLPMIIEMFPINLRTFYGALFHLVVCIFEITLPLLAKLTKRWSILQMTATLPLLLTAPLHWIAFESIFWYLAYKEYDKAIKTLTELAKRNGILFESKFKQAKEFLHAKHSKATQVDIMPLLRLKDVESLGQKYPTVDMAELQKQKLNRSKFRRFLNSLKGDHYRSTNTIYRPFDFIYSPTLFIYVLILVGLWLTNGLAASIEGARTNYASLDRYFMDSLINLTCIGSSALAIGLSLLRVSRRWMIFLAYLLMEICLLGSLIQNYDSNNHSDKKDIALQLIYFTCKFSTHFGFVFLMLITAELFPTSLRCTGMGICFSFKLIGDLIVSKELLSFNNGMHRLIYGLLTLLFGALALFLPETKNLPLPRTVLQIEAMQTAIGKKFRSRKVKLAYEKRLLKQKEEDVFSNRRDNDGNITASHSYEKAALLNNTNINDNSYNDSNMQQNRSNSNPGGIGHDTSNLSNVATNANKKNTSAYVSNNYDTVTSVHDIEQDSHVFYYPTDLKLMPTHHQHQQHECDLPNIAEVPSRNLTRNNSIVDASDYLKSKP